MTVLQIQRTLEEVDYVAYFHSGFRPWYETEMACSAFFDDFFRSWMEVGASSLVFDISVAFNTINQCAEDTQLYISTSAI